MDLALFHQTTPDMEKAPFSKKLAWAELWATLEWMFVIPSIRYGELIFNRSTVIISILCI